MTKVSKLELTVFEGLEKTIGRNKTTRIFRLLYGLFYWIKYEPSILKSKIQRMIMYLDIIRMKIQIAIYKKLLGE